MLVAAPAALAWWPFIRQIIGGEPVGQNPVPDWVVWLLWLLIGLALPFLFSRLRLVLEVTDAEVLIRYRPFSRRAIALADIQQVQARQYSAVKEYGGWGVKGWSKEKMAYNVSGNRGVELTLTRRQAGDARLSTGRRTGRGHRKPPPGRGRDSP